MADSSGDIINVPLCDLPLVSGRLRDARVERGLQQRDLADLAGVQPNTVSRWERGVSTPVFLDVVGLAGLLGKPYQWFYGLSVSAGQPGVTLSPGEVELRSRVDTIVSLIFAGADARRISLKSLLGFDLPGVSGTGESGSDEASDFVSLYSLAAAAGPGSPLSDHEEVVGRILVERRPFRALSVNPVNCDLISVSGESMEPTLADGSMVLVDRGSRDLRDGRIFVLRTPDGLLVKRVRMSGARWMIVSDNPAWPVDNLDPDSDVIGEVRWATVEV